MNLPLETLAILYDFFSVLQTLYNYKKVVQFTRLQALLYR